MHSALLHGFNTLLNQFLFLDIIFISKFCNNVKKKRQYP